MDVRESRTKAEIERYLGFCRETLAKARVLVREMTAEQYNTKVKPDKSFVTEVDMAVEKLIREEVERSFPSHGVLGEELPTLRPDAEYMWICDPIDGTQNLVHGLPTFGCILGLHYQGRPLAGGIDHPLLDLCYTAGYGLGAWENGRRLRIEDEAKVSLDTNDIVVLATRGMFERSGQGELFDRFMQSHPSTRVFYDCFSTTRAAAGQVAALVEFNVRIWDLAASEILITEAGGSYHEVQVRQQEEGKEALRSVIMGQPSAVAILTEQFS